MGGDILTYRPYDINHVSKGTEMYDTNELIDRIRDLENQTTVDTVYMVVTSQANSDGSAFGNVAAVYDNPANVPDPDDMINEAIELCYESYIEQKNDCCGASDDCCGSLHDLDGFKDSFIKAGEMPNYSLKMLEKLKSGDKTQKYIYLGSFSDEYNETTTETYVQTKKITR